MYCHESCKVAKSFSTTDICSKINKMQELLKNNRIYFETYEEYNKCLLTAALRIHNLEAIQLFLRFGIAKKWTNSTKIDYLKDFEFVKIFPHLLPVKPVPEAELVDILLMASKMRQLLESIDAKAFNKYIECMLIESVQQHNLGAMKLLLMFGANPNGNSSINGQCLQSLELTGIVFNRDFDFVQFNKCEIPPLLFYAILKKDHEIIRLLLRYKVNVNLRCWDLTPLQFACLCRSSKTVKLLLDAGANVEGMIEARRWTALHLAIMTMDEASACLLIKRGANFHSADKSITPMHWAAETGCIAPVKLMLERGAKVYAEDLRTCTPLSNAIEFGLCNLRKFLEGYCKSGGHGVCHMDIKKYGANFDTFASAVFCRYVDMVKLLLKYGANNSCANKIINTSFHVMFCDKYLCPKSKNHDIQKIEEKAHRTVVKLLLEHGVTIKAANSDSVSLLNVAIGGGSSLLVELLLEYGATPNTSDESGFSPLYVAGLLFSKEDQEKASENREKIELLLGKGASPYTKFNDGMTIFDKLLELQNKNLLKLLLQHELDTDTRPNLMDYLPQLKWQSCNELNQILLRHLARQDPELSSEKLQTLGLSDEQCAYYINCLEEMKSMQLEMLYEGVSLYDLFRRNKSNLTYLIRNEGLVKALEVNCFSEKYPIFEKIIKETIVRARKYIEMQESAIKSLQMMWKYQLPYLVNLMIIENLIEKQLQSLNHMHLGIL